MSMHGTEFELYVFIYASSVAAALAVLIDDAIEQIKHRKAKDE